LGVASIAQKNYSRLLFNTCAVANILAGVG